MQYAQKGSVYMRTEAQKRADKKYKEKTYKTFTVNAKISEYEKILLDFN